MNDLINTKKMTRNFIELEEEEDAEFKKFE